MLSSNFELECLGEFLTSLNFWAPAVCLFGFGFSHHCLPFKLCCMPAACWAPLTMGLSRQEYRVGCHSLLQGGSSQPRDQTFVSGVSYIACRFFTTAPSGKPFLSNPQSKTQPVDSSGTSAAAWVGGALGENGCTCVWGWPPWLSTGNDHSTTNQLYCSTKKLTKQKKKWILDFSLILKSVHLGCVVFCFVWPFTWESLSNI